MIERINAPISVTCTFDHRAYKATPLAVLWGRETYKVTRVGHHHTYRQGRTLFHVFSVNTETLYFRLVFNTDTLGWTLEEISDGLPA